MEEVSQAAELVHIRLVREQVGDILDLSIWKTLIWPSAMSSFTKLMYNVSHLWVELTGPSRVSTAGLLSVRITDVLS